MFVVVIQRILFPAQADNHPVLYKKKRVCAGVTSSIYETGSKSGKLEFNNLFYEIKHGIKVL
jgi:hypothetical protein